MQFLDSVLRHITTEYLNSVLLDDAVDVTKYSPAKIESLKRQAERVLKTEVFKMVVRDIVERTKNMILLRATTETEVMVCRGRLLGLQDLERALLSWCAKSKESESDETDPNA